MSVYCKNSCILTKYPNLYCHICLQLRKRREVLGVTDDGETENADVILEGKIAEIVYEKARENVPDDVSFHISLVSVARCFPFTASLQDTMYKE